MASLNTDDLDSLNMNILKVCFRNDSSSKHANGSGQRQAWGNSSFPCPILLCFLKLHEFLKNDVP